LLIPIIKKHLMKTLFTLCSLILSIGMFAQELSGKATYQIKDIFIIKDPKPEHNTPEFKERLESIKKSLEKTFVLEFTKNTSIYSEEEKLPNVNKDGSTHSVSYGWKKLYKNTKENYFLMENDLLDKIFLIKDTLDVTGWELSTETKQIGNYTAYKATKTVIPKIINNKEQSTNFLSMNNQKELNEIVYTAWYTPEIPIPNGPEKFGGLPGLILELHTTNRIYLCSEIILNPKKPFEFNVPKGKTISQQEFDEMLDERAKEYQRKSKVTR